MSTPGPAPDIFGYPESRTGKIAIGLIAAFRNHERSVFVSLAMAAASLFLLFMFVELTFPHE